MTTSTADRGAAPIVYRNVPAYVEDPSTAPTDWQFTAHVTKTAKDRGTVGIMVYDNATHTPVIKLQYVRSTNFEFVVNDNRVSFGRSVFEDSFSFRLVRDGALRTWSAFYRLRDTEDWNLIGRVTDGVPAILKPQLALFSTTGNRTSASFEFVEIDVSDERPAYGHSIGLDVGTRYAVRTVRSSHVSHFQLTCRRNTSTNWR